MLVHTPLFHSFVHDLWIHSWCLNGICRVVGNSSKKFTLRVSEKVSASHAFLLTADLYLYDVKNNFKSSSFYNVCEHHVAFVKKVLNPTTFSSHLLTD